MQTGVYSCITQRGKYGGGSNARYTRSQEEELGTQSEGFRELTRESNTPAEYLKDE